MAQTDPAPERGEDEGRLHALRRLFVTVLWAFPFFLPIRVPLLDVVPDAGGWAVALLAAVGPRTAGGRALRRIAVVGLLLSLGRIIVFKLTGSETTFFALHAAGLVAAAVFVWRLCGIVESAARECDYRGVRRSAVQGRYLFLVHTALVYGGTVAPRIAGGGLAGVVAALGVVLVSALILSYMMAVLAGGARMCRTELRAAADEEAG